MQQCFASRIAKVVQHTLKILLLHCNPHLPPIASSWSPPPLPFLRGVAEH